jgi:hypothetical protein
MSFIRTPSSHEVLINNLSCWLDGKCSRCSTLRSAEPSLFLSFTFLLNPQLTMVRNWVSHGSYWQLTSLPRTPGAQARAGGGLRSRSSLVYGFNRLCCLIYQLYRCKAVNDRVDGPGCAQVPNHKDENPHRSQIYK